MHPYTAALLSASPLVMSTKPESINKRIILSGEIPDPSNPPSGCVFRTRCPIVKEKCAIAIPQLIQHKNQLVSCHFAGELKIN